MHKITINSGYPPVAMAHATLEIRRVYKCKAMGDDYQPLIFYKRLGNKYYFFDYKTLEQKTFHGGDTCMETELHLSEIIIKRG